MIPIKLPVETGEGKLAFEVEAQRQEIEELKTQVQHLARVIIETIKAMDEKERSRFENSGIGIPTIAGDVSKLKDVVKESMTFWMMKGKLKASEILEKTDKKFGTGRFYNLRNQSYCAVGVLVEEYCQYGKTEGFSDIISILVQKYGINASTYYDLIAFNDKEAKSFKDCAKWLRARGFWALKKEESIEYLRLVLIEMIKLGLVERVGEDEYKVTPEAYALGYKTTPRLT